MAFLKACSQVTQEINATHRPGWREHGLIKGKADFSSCSSCTDRQKNTKKAYDTNQFLLGAPFPCSSKHRRAGGVSQPRVGCIPEARCSCTSGTVWLGPWHCRSEMANLVSSSRVQESLTVQTLECRSCLGAQLDTQTGRAGGK